MQKTAAHYARDLSPELRRAAEALLGQALDEDETVTLRASKGFIVKEATAGKARDEGKEYVVQDGDVMLFKFNV